MDLQPRWAAVESKFWGKAMVMLSQLFPLCFPLKPSSCSFARAELQGLGYDCPKFTKTARACISSGNVRVAGPAARQEASMHRCASHQNLLAARHAFGIAPYRVCCLLFLFLFFFFFWGGGCGRYTLGGKAGGQSYVSNAVDSRRKGEERRFKPYADSQEFTLKAGAGFRLRLGGWDCEWVGAGG